MKESYANGNREEMSRCSKDSIKRGLPLLHQDISDHHESRRRHMDENK